MRSTSGRNARGARPCVPRLLVVDDAEGIRTYLANLLELRGYQVDTAQDDRFSPSEVSRQDRALPLSS